VPRGPRPPVLGPDGLPVVRSKSHKRKAGPLGEGATSPLRRGQDGAEPSPARKAPPKPPAPPANKCGECRTCVNPHLKKRCLRNHDPVVPRPKKEGVRPGGGVSSPDGPKAEGAVGASSADAQGNSLRDAQPNPGAKSTQELGKCGTCRMCLMPHLKKRCLNTTRPIIRRGPRPPKSSLGAQGEVAQEKVLVAPNPAAVEPPAPGSPRDVVPLQPQAAPAMWPQLMVPNTSGMSLPTMMPYLPMYMALLGSMPAGHPGWASMMMPGPSEGALAAGNARIEIVKPTPSV